MVAVSPEVALGYDGRSADGGSAGASNHRALGTSFGSAGSPR
ncbi:MAG: hypothetical protein ABI794_15565 [Betaproteobacteria bacterium]